MEGTMREDRKLILGALVLALVVFGLERLYSPVPAAAALQHYFTFAPLDTEDTNTATHDIVQLPPIPTATLQLVVTGEPTTCTYRLEGQLRDATGWDVLAEITGSECVDGKMVHFESKAVDVLRGRLHELTGGTTPEVTGLVKMVTR
jgi:hypothetical protein